MDAKYFSNSLAYRIWDTRYRSRERGGMGDGSIEDTWHRVARSLAAAEHENTARWEERFYGALHGFHFLPGGRILAGVGIDRQATLFNCFVMGVPADPTTSRPNAITGSIFQSDDGSDA